MSGGLVTAAYIVAAILFIFSLAGLSKHETSRQGNNFGIAGMAISRFNKLQKSNRNPLAEGRLLF